MCCKLSTSLPFFVQCFLKCWTKCNRNTIMAQTLRQKTGAHNNISGPMYGKDYRIFSSETMGIYTVYIYSCASGEHAQNFKFLVIFFKMIAYPQTLP
ncbi:hypothetical protein GDO81_004662 [Engystomops pustulosus]|uniref:Secreted protein n=1 Tax=Engystomops pustulosus TaxID=76066 RepID=A0AAV7CHL9_ENGPU|nr:hypothetical protein GDO81_004662 [Engystomops pustulosus]